MWNTQKDGILITLMALLMAAGQGIAADLTNPYQIMQGYYEAIGGLERLNKVTASYSEGRIRYDGLQGNFRRWDARPLQYRIEQDYSIISQIEGDTGDYSWFFDTNCQLLIHRDNDTLKRREISLLLDRYEHLNPRSPYFSLSFSGVAAVDARPCYEVILSSTINSDVTHFFFDTVSLLLRQSIHRQPDTMIITTYSDYREVDGLMLSFHQHARYLPWEKEEETWTTSHMINGRVEQWRFRPPKQQKDYQFPEDRNAVTVPFKFSENLMYLAVTIGDDTGFWLLDSGASMSVIDAQYARKRGLDIQGSIRGYGFGDHFELSFVNVPSYRVGGIVFRDRRFYVSEGLAAKSYEPQIFGILGYDFLSRFVVEIDYDLQQATFHLPETFHYTGRGVTLDAPLKYRTLTLPVTLNNRFTSFWSLDLGSYRSSIHYPFGEKHGLIKKDGVETVSQGMAGMFYEVTVQFECLAIDGLKIDQPLVSIPAEKGKGVTALGEVGGNLGNSTLRHFHIFLNYPAQQVIMEKGARYNGEFPRDKSGMLIGRSENSLPMISFVAQDSPAAVAGLFAGDIITEMNGRSISRASPVLPLRQMLRGNTGQRIPLTVTRGGRPISTAITLQKLYKSEQSGCTTIAD